MRILCLHGCRQTAKVFKCILTPFINKSEHQYYFINGQFKCKEGNMWYSERFKVGISEYKPKIVDPTLEQVHNTINKHNIDMLLGFSQGANVIDTYLQLTKDERIKRAILFSGYSFTNIIRECKTPVITVHSVKDDIVDPKHNPIYINNKIYIHNHGHKIITTEIMRNALYL